MPSRWNTITLDRCCSDALRPLRIQAVGTDRQIFICHPTSTLQYVLQISFLLCFSYRATSIESIMSSWMPSRSSLDYLDRIACANLVLLYNTSYCAYFSIAKNHTSCCTDQTTVKSLIMPKLYENQQSMLFCSLFGGRESYISCLDVLGCNEQKQLAKGIFGKSDFPLER